MKSKDLKNKLLENPEVRREYYKYLSREEVEELFDDEFLDVESWAVEEIEGQPHQVTPKQVKYFISTLRTSDLDALIEHLRGMKDNGIDENTGLPHYLPYNKGMVTGRNTTIDDFITYLEGLKKTL